MGSPDVAIVGAGIVGCALAAFLAEGGASVAVVERDAVAAGASGRNSGVVQHPMDAALLPLFTETVEHYRDLAAHGFALPAEPNGVLVLAEDEAALAPERDALARAFPELAPELLAPGEPARLEPAVSERLAGVRLRTGYAVPPAGATRAFAARAIAAGADFRVGAAAAVGPEGLAVDGEIARAGVVVVAAGPWAPELVDPSGAWRPIVPLWGVNVEMRLPDPPRHALEEAGIDQLVAQLDEPPPLFSLVTADGVSSLGSTFLPAAPDADAIAPRLRDRGARFVPALAAMAIGPTRACARPLSADGRPLLGRVGERLYVAAGHGPWGISLGPASARRVADLVLGREAAPEAAFDPARF